MPDNSALWLPYARYLDSARVNWGRATPFRLGLEVGQGGADLPNPYSTPRARNCYVEGVKTGAAWRLKNQQAQLKEKQNG